MEKEKLLEMLKDEMGQWRTRLDELKVQASLGQSELKDILRPEIERIEEELVKVEGKMKELQSASEGALDEFRHGAERALKVMKESFEKASSHFQK